eukprot:COSAG02_NODE_457_length_21950_cov_35.452794_5_plen_222_part_00
MDQYSRANVEHCSPQHFPLFIWRCVVTWSCVVRTFACCVAFVLIPVCSCAYGLVEYAPSCAYLMGQRQRRWKRLCLFVAMMLMLLIDQVVARSFADCRCSSMSLLFLGLFLFCLSSTCSVLAWFSVMAACAAATALRSDSMANAVSFACSSSAFSFVAMASRLRSSRADSSFDAAASASFCRSFALTCRSCSRLRYSASARNASSLRILSCSACHVALSCF